MKVHLGVGHGDAAGDAPVTFNGNAVTASNLFSGKDGQAWDDHTLSIPSHLLPKGTKSVTTTIGGGSDCLGWAYTALTYKQP